MSFFRKQHLVLLLILAGFAIRVYALNDVRMTGDDVNVTQYFLEISFADLLTATTSQGFPENLLPNTLIWLANKLSWQLFMLRWPGVLFNVLTLAVTYKLAEKLLGSAGAIAATFLMTLSYYHVGLGHMVRGYSQMVFFAVLSFYFLLRGMERQHWRDWLLYALAAALAVSSHFFASTFLAAQGIIVAIWLVLRVFQQQPKQFTPFFRQQVIPPLAGGLGSVAIIIIFFAPHISRFWQGFITTDSDFAVSADSLSTSLLPYVTLFERYGGAVSDSGQVPVWSSLLFLIFILAGIVYLLRVKPVAAGILVGWLIIPPLLMLLGQAYISWFYARGRHLAYMLPAFLILAAAGWVGLIKITKGFKPVVGTGFLGVSLVAVLAISWLSLSNAFQIITAGNWQNVSSFLIENMNPTDMIICEPFRHGWKAVDLEPHTDCTQDIGYRVGSQTKLVYPVHNLYHVATYDTFERNPILLQRNPRIWLVLWGSEPSPYQELTPSASFDRFGHAVVLGPIVADNIIVSLGQVLEQTSQLSEDSSTQFTLLTRLAELQAALGQAEATTETLAKAKTIISADDQAKDQLALVEQYLNQPPLIVTPDYYLPTELGGQILFRGYSLMPETPVPGQPLQLTLFWEALAPIEVNYSAFLHLRNEANQTVAQLDFFPNRPTSSWWIGDVLYDTHQLVLPAELPAGKYRLLMGLYDLETLERLPVANDSTGENAITLTELEL